jgi:hypothetical protein
MVCFSRAKAASLPAQYVFEWFPRARFDGQIAGQAVADPAQRADLRVNLSRFDSRQVRL